METGITGASKILIADTETTGLNYFKYEVIQISGVKIHAQNPSTNFNYYIEAEKEMEEAALKVNGYYKGKWADLKMPTHAKCYIAESLYQMMKDVDMVIAHNAPHDKGFIYKFITENSDYEFSDLPKYWFDTSTIAQYFRFVTGEFESTSLEYMIKKLDIKNIIRSGNHDALEDAQILIEVFFKLIDKLFCKK